MINPSPDAARPRILIVATQRDEAMQRCAQVIREAGAAIEWAGDVYAAMATLARGTQFVSVLVDNRYLDESEAAFLNIAPRYFHRIDFVVPELSGNGLRGHSSTDSIRRLPLARLAECVPATAVPVSPEALDQTAAEPLAEKIDEVPPSAVNEPQASRMKLSTDDGPRMDEDGLSLHEAVRKRMGADDPRVVRRRPPVKAPTPEENQTNPAAIPAPLTDDEINALLDPRQLGGRASGPPPREQP